MANPRKCRVRGCKSLNNEMRFFNFPQDPIENQKWRDNLEYKEWDFLPATAAVCLLHFEESAKGLKYLRKGAIPTLNLGYDHPPPHSNHILNQKILGRACCIENCIRNEKLKLYRFPANNDSWFKVCNVDRSKCERPYICELHFDNKFISEKRLLFGAFPSFNLPPQISGNNLNPSAHNGIGPNETSKSNGNKRYCCIKNCDLIGNGTLFSFPNVEEVRLRWIKACQINPAECGELYICARHFHPNFLINDNKQLKDGAFPSLNLNLYTRTLLPTLQKRAIPQNTIKLPLNFEQHYFVESKRRRLYSQDTDENSRCISFVSENEELIGNISKPVKNSIAEILECHNAQKIVDNKNSATGLDIASFSNNSLDSSIVTQTSNDKLYKCDNKLLEKRLAELETHIEFQTEEKSKNDDVHLEKSDSVLDASHDLQSKSVDVCVNGHFEKRLAELESQMKSKLQKSCSCDHDHFEKRITELEAEVEYLKTKHRILADRAILPFNNASRESITFARMIVDSPKRYYSENEKFMAQNLTYISPKSYDFMREELKFVLPHKSILRRWGFKSNCIISGIDDDESNALKKIVSQMSESERICQIMFDEIDIQKDQTTSSTITYAAKARANIKCCLFMVKGMLNDWKYILSYYIDNSGFNAYNLLRYLNQTIVFAESVGLKIKAIVCDQTLCNAHIYKMLYVTEKKPYILHEKEKIHCFFDYFYLIKSIRNSFLAHDIQTFDGVARFKVIRKLYGIEKAYANLGIFPKLTPSHLYPDHVEKNNVYLAAQLLSHSVAMGIEKAINEKIFGTDAKLLKYARATQKFVQRINDLFDEFDHRAQVGESNDTPRNRSYAEKIIFLKDHLKFVHSLEEHNTVNMRFISGLILTIKSMINFYEDFSKNQNNLNINDLSKLNQDALNIFLHKLSGIKDNSTCPTENEIRTFIRNSRKEFEQKYQNCKDQTVDNLNDVNVAIEEPYDNSDLSEEQFEKYIEVVED